MSLQKWLHDQLHRAPGMPAHEGAAERHLVLPLSSHISHDDVGYVCATVRDARIPSRPWRRAERCSAGSARG